MNSSIVSIIICIITFALLIINKLPMSIVALGASALMAICIPEMSLADAYSGFSAAGWPMVVGMLLVSDAMFQTGVANRIGEAISRSWFAKSERRFIVTVAAICTVQSAFMSNNGTVAIWMPLAAVVASASNGKIRSKMVIFPIGTAAILGGACTLIGSTSQLAANAVLQGYAGYEAGLGIFDQSKIMVPAAILQVFFWGTIGYTLLKKVLKPEDPHFNDGNMYAEASSLSATTDYSNVPKWKGNVAMGTMLLCIFLFLVCGYEPFKSHFNIGIIGMLGAVLVLGTGCLDIRHAYADLPWNILITIGCISGLGSGLEASGGGALIANTIINWVGGEHASIAALTIALSLLTSVLTNFMSNMAVAPMLTPIAISMALELGISPIPWTALIAVCSNLAIATSFGTSVNMQILPAGYKMSDFVKIGGPLLIMVIAVVTACSVVFLF